MGSLQPIMCTVRLILARLPSSRLVIFLLRFNPSHLCLADDQTPNRVLGTADIPKCAERPSEVPEGVTYPSGKRYTLQWLVKADSTTLHFVAENNVDATFKKDTEQPTPSDLLLHYNYGAAVVKRWGHGREVLQSRPNIPRPTVPTPAPMGPVKVQRDRSTIIQKRDAARRADESGGGIAAARDGRGEMLDAEDQTGWDEDDVMLFFWGNSHAAAERHRQKQDESVRNMEQWRQGVRSISV
jgi:hypothetical protein